MLVNDESPFIHLYRANDDNKSVERFNTSRTATKCVKLYIRARAQNFQLKILESKDAILYHVRSVSV